MNKPKYIQHLRTTNDINGNPRRVFVLYDENGDIVKTIDEGYRGFPREYRSLKQLPQIEVLPKEYRAFKNFK